MEKNVARFDFEDISFKLSQLGIETSESGDRSYWLMKRGDFTAAFWPLTDTLRIRFQNKERIILVKLIRLIRVMKRVIGVLDKTDVSISLILRKVNSALREKEDEYELVPILTENVVEQMSVAVTEIQIMSNGPVFDQSAPIQEGVMSPLEYYRHELRIVSNLIRKAYESKSKGEMACYIEEAFDRLGNITISGSSDDVSL